MTDEWTVVNRGTQRKVAKRRYGNSSDTSSIFPTIDEDKDKANPSEVRMRIAACSEQLLHSQFYSNAVRAWEAHTVQFRDDEHEAPALATTAKSMMNEIVCYGIGNFANNNKSSHWHGSLWQLALALELPSMVNMKHPDNPPCPMVYYDPLVTDTERKILQHSFDIQVLTTNERGKRSSGPQSDKNSTETTCITTLFFMPHCPKGLYENVLWANWNQLQQNPSAICIIGNSLATYVEMATTSVVSYECSPPSCLELVQPFLREQLISYSKKDVRDMPGNFEAAFNDTYLTWFVMENNNQDTNTASGGHTDDEKGTISRLVWPERPHQPSDDGQKEVL
jgi:SRR1